MADPIDLGLCNKGSAKVASFLVKFTMGKAGEYKYPNKRTGNEVTVHVFEAKLLGEEDSSYCIGFVKGTSPQVQEAAERFKDDTVWLLSKVVFDPLDKTAYISSPLALRVDLVKSRLVPVASDSQADLAYRVRLAEKPVPARTVADTACIKTNRSTDLLAIVKEIKRERRSKAGEQIADVTLIDDSKTSAGRLATVIVSVFGTEKLDLLATHVGEPMSFFNLVVSCKDGKTEITHYPDDVVTPAPTCPKTTSLLANKGGLKNAADTEQLTSDWQPQHTTLDVSGDQPLSCAAFLDFTSEEPKADMPDIVQLFWLFVEEPAPGDEIVDSSGTRVWYQAKARDLSGMAVCGMPQRNAFKLSQTTNLSEFQEKYNQGALNMPLFCHARLSRTVRENTSGNPQQGPYINSMIEEIEPVLWNLKSAPNEAFADVLNILNNCPRHDEGLLFAFLADLKPDPYYGFQVFYNGVESVKATYVVVLIASSQNSNSPTDLGGGYKVTTSKIVDVANPDAEQVGTYTVTGYCSMEELLNFKLDPPRGKGRRFAVVLISKVDSEGFLVYKQEHVEPADSEHAVACFRKLRALSAKIKPTSSAKRSHAMGDLFNAAPRDTKRCRTLQNMPTDVSLDDV